MTVLNFKKSNFLILWKITYESRGRFVLMLHKDSYNAQPKNALQKIEFLLCTSVYTFIGVKPKFRLDLKYALPKKNVYSKFICVFKH